MCGVRRGLKVATGTSWLVSKFPDTGSSSVGAAGVHCRVASASCLRAFASCRHACSSITAFLVTSCCRAMISTCLASVVCVLLSGCLVYTANNLEARCKKLTSRM